MTILLFNKIPIDLSEEEFKSWVDQFGSCTVMYVSYESFNEAVVTFSHRSDANLCMDCNEKESLIYKDDKVFIPYISGSAFLKRKSKRREKKQEKVQTKRVYKSARKSCNPKQISDNEDKENNI